MTERAVSSSRLQQPGARQCTVRREAEPSLNQSVHTGITSHYTVVRGEDVIREDIRGPGTSLEALI